MKIQELEKRYGKVRTFTNQNNADLTDRLDMIFLTLIEILRELQKGER